MNRLFYLIHFLLFFAACQPASEPEQTTHYPTDLWVDQTEVYLPETAEWTNRVEVADLNADGLPDLLFANGGNYSEPGPVERSRVFINQGPDQRFQEVELFGDESSYARVIKVQDLNDDGLVDIVVGTTYQTQSQLYLGIKDGRGTGDGGTEGRKDDGTGGRKDGGTGGRKDDGMTSSVLQTSEVKEDSIVFKNATATHLPQMKLSVGDLEFGDVDLDGDLDMVLVGWGPGNNMTNAGGVTRLWLNDGDGRFTDVTETQMPNIPIQFSWDLEFVDFDNDFDLDLVISCKRCAGSKLYINDGTGKFEDHPRGLPSYTNNYDFEVMDLNNDGTMDLVTINDGEIVDGISWSRREHIFINKDGQGFNDLTSEHWPDSANIGEDDNNISFLDLDSDGDPDFMVSSLTGEDRMMINDGTGHFQLAQPVMDGKATPSTLSLVFSDINLDGKMDIVMGQGEGEEGIEERIFIGKAIEKDTAPPVIVSASVDLSDAGHPQIHARIHDHKTPMYPHDWKSVALIQEDDTTSLRWYGEYLWTIKSEIREGAKLCATDRSGNTACIPIKP